MLFSSMIFLWIFLPLLLILYRLVPSGCRNMVLLVASLVFYAWGEPKYIVLILISVTANYLFGLFIGGAGMRERPESRRICFGLRRDRLLLALCLLFNLGLLGYFKYFNFFGSLINRIAGGQAFGIREIALPLGISFYTFQALSYVIDVYRGVTAAQKNYFTLVLYIMLFPQLIAGPIVKYRDVEGQLSGRVLTGEKAAYGVKRFVYGLSKKVLLSNTLALYADMIMELPAESLSTGAAWLGAVFYTLQIYFDFSGYSDMAIGLGKLLGFDFMENFNYPYLADSIRDFWRRWHISLSSWFRDYVYIPLGGSRRGLLRTCFNLMAVFLLTGLWHGAGVNFILWGAYYGVFLALERVAAKRRADAENRAAAEGRRLLSHLYVLVVVVSGWVLFRLEDLPAAAAYLGRMFVPHGGAYGPAQLIGSKALLVLTAGVLLCGGLQKLLEKKGIGFWKREDVSVGEALLQGALLALCIVMLVSDTYNPFIYFRF